MTSCLLQALNSRRMVSGTTSILGSHPHVVTGQQILRFQASGSADIAPKNLILLYPFAPHDIWCGWHHTPAIAEANQAALFKPSVPRISRITTMATIAHPEYDIIFAGGKLVHNSSRRCSIYFQVVQRRASWLDALPLRIRL